MGILDGPTPLDSLFTKHDGNITHSWTLQVETEVEVYKLYKEVLDTDDLNNVTLERERHLNYLLSGSKGLNKYFVVLDASRPWICYWVVHALDILGRTIEPDFMRGCIEMLSKYQNPTGGFGGGFGQLSHLAASYAAVNALAVFGTQEAYDVIDRENLYKWLLSLKQPDGSYIMHKGGEVDVRGVYCALSIAVLTNILTPELIEGTPEWIKKCQTYEGGIGGVPGIEAHGGYAFCGLAAMELMGTSEKLDISKLLRWAVSLQMPLEGGFQGRPNKLVDGCYSFWVGGLYPLLETITLRQQLREKKQAIKSSACQLLFNREALQEYILIAAQSQKGGLVDKPPKGPDFYHTCYCLSGLSTAQNHVVYDIEKASELERQGKLNATARSLLWAEDVSGRLVIGKEENLVVCKRSILDEK
ncbi:1652_t:CDS:2 [Paraglomus brasilianum]|uniref:Protein farnesyltransferase subunit beta n=1 Tax=Paraglomus brasilianum TaxID=144538 RepID=A0A9N8YUQ5_9GLOM|nr:1652_t:CDS:2 [Paraglomus brasilianum]